MKQLIILALLTVSIMGCGELKGDRGPQGPAAPTPVLTDMEQQVATLLADENEYRLGLGQTLLTSGLSCTLQTFTSGDRIQASIAGHNTLAGLTTVGTFLLEEAMNQPDTNISVGNSVLPEPARSLYKNMYLLRCQGQIVIIETGYHYFEITSDDGSVVYLDGSKLIDNDNNHGATVVGAMKYLRKGVHTFRVDYAQSGGGNQALVLKLNGELMNPVLWAH